MPVYIVTEGLFEGFSKLSFLFTVLKVVPWIGLIYLLKRYFGGATNTSERMMHSKVVMMTGGTSGIGAEVARALASRGAQLVLLTQHELSDPFLQEYIMDLRAETNNELITAEHVDLSSLHSIRKFATKWVDNAPPRRLDMIILCANTMTPKGGKITSTEDGLESNWGLNYIANFHLLSILSPALRAQPPDRDVRVIFGTCSSYMGGHLPDLNAATDKTVADAKSKSKGKQKSKAQTSSKPEAEAIPFSPSSVYATSKLALMTFAAAFQKHLSSYSRPDKQEMNAHVVIVDPGWTRTPGMRRYLTFGSLFGLFLYLIMWPLWWLVLKGPQQGAQPFLYAAMEAQLGRGEGGKFIKECREVKFLRSEIEDEEVQKKLWQASEKTIEALEKESALRRAREKKEKDEQESKENKSDKSKENLVPPSTTGNNNNQAKAGSRRTRKAA